MPEILRKRSAYKTVTQWYRRMYMPNEDDWGKWDASPIHAPPAILAASPRTWIAAAEQDILCEEAKCYGEKLRENGVATTVTVYDGSTHSLLMLAGEFGPIQLFIACKEDKASLTISQGKPCFWRGASLDIC